MNFGNIPILRIPNKSLKDMSFWCMSHSEFGIDFNGIFIAYQIGEMFQEKSQDTGNLYQLFKQRRRRRLKCHAWVWDRLIGTCNSHGSNPFHICIHWRFCRVILVDDSHQVSIQPALMNIICLLSQPKLYYYYHAQTWIIRYKRARLYAAGLEASDRSLKWMVCEQLKLWK